MKISLDLNLTLVICLLAAFLMGGLADVALTTAMAPKPQTVSCANKEYLVIPNDSFNQVKKLCGDATSLAAQVTAQATQMAAQSKTDVLDCANTSYTITAANDSQDIQAACASVTALNQKWRTMMEDQRRASTHLSCMSSAGNFIYNANVANANADTFRSLCDKYRPQFDTIEQSQKKVVKDATDLQRTNIAMTQLRMQFFAEAQKLAAPNDDMNSASQEMRDAQESLKEKIRQAGGGMTVR
jgi:hypothetical protein